MPRSYNTSKTSRGKAHHPEAYCAAEGSRMHERQRTTSFEVGHDLTASGNQVGDSIFEIYNSLRSVMPIHVLLSNVYFNL